MKPDLRLFHKKYPKTMTRKGPSIFLEPSGGKVDETVRKLPSSSG